MTDGINTVAVMLKHKHSRKNALAFLVMDAVAPVLGVLLFTTLITLPESFLVYVLAFFVGEFINIGAVTLLPEAWGHPSKKIVIAMAAGILLITVLTSLIAI